MMSRACVTACVTFMSASNCASLSCLDSWTCMRQGVGEGAAGEVSKRRRAKKGHRWDAAQGCSTGRGHWEGTGMQHGCPPYQPGMATISAARHVHHVKHGPGPRLVARGLAGHCFDCQGNTRGPHLGGHSGIADGGWTGAKQMKSQGASCMR